MSAASVSPLARRTPVARPFSTRMRSTSALQRSAPPCPSMRPHEPVHERAGAADREVHAPLPLEEGDERVDRRGGERISADQQRMERHHLAEPVVLDERAHEPVNGAEALQPHHLGHDLRHRRPRAERHVRELLEADTEDLLAGGEETLVARHVAGREARHLPLHGLGVARVVEHLAVVETDPIERRDRPHVDVVGELLCRRAPRAPRTAEAR